MLRALDKLAKIGREAVIAELQKTGMPAGDRTHAGAGEPGLDFA